MPEGHSEWAKVYEKKNIQLSGGGDLGPGFGPQLREKKKIQLSKHEKFVS